MTPAVIEGFTAAPGAPENWDPAKHGVCSALPIRVEIENDLQWMRSAWEPSPGELAALSSGAHIELGISGRAHPVVNMRVGPVPAEHPAEVPAVSFVTTREVADDGAVWVRVVGRFGRRSFPAGMEIENPNKPDLSPITLEDASARLIAAVMAHARQHGWA